MAGEFLLTQQVSEEYGIPEATLRYWRQHNRGPASFLRGKRRVVYRRSEVERWFSEQEAATTRGGDAA